ncbi:MAG TPA: M42 family peptidase [Candidatus Sabulitectum sp.]|nr:M42 family peptidase [Candidatus Sabulitectum sp.]
MELLKRLCETDGISGREDAVVELLREELKDHADEIRTDAMKNIIALKKGTQGENRPRVMLAGHIDEIGFLIYNVDDKGFASIAPVGGWMPGSIAGHTVKVHTRKGEVLTGVVSTHPALTPEAAAKAPEMEKLFIDFGMPGDQVKEKVERGDWVTMDTRFQELGDCFVAKAFDDRVGAYIIAEAFKKYDNPSIDVYCVGTSQEEVGIRGATVAALSIQPHIGIAADITGAGDTPGFPATHKIAELGKGVAVKQQDASVICSTSLVDFMRNIAEEKEIDHQMEILVRGGTDTSAMQKFGGDTHATCLSIPTRNGHSPVAIIHRHDVETAVELLTEFLNRAHLFQV